MHKGYCYAKEADPSSEPAPVLLRCFPAMSFDDPSRVERISPNEDRSKLRRQALALRRMTKGRDDASRWEIDKNVAPATPAPNVAGCCAAVGAERVRDLTADGWGAVVR